MKKILKITGIVFASFIGLAIIGSIIGGSSGPKVEKTTLADGSSSYQVQVESKDHDGTKKDVSFTVTDSVMKAKNLNEEKLVNLCKEAVGWAAFGAKNRLTYKIGSMGFLAIDDKGVLYAYITGEAQNSFGVPSTISTTIPFKNNSEVDIDNITAF